MIPQLARVAKTEFGVPFFSASGFEGVGLKHDVIRAAIHRDKPTVIRQIGDHDASGVSIFDAFCDDILAFCDVYGLERSPVKVDSDGNGDNELGAGQCPRPA
jgi:hypothetical protein